MIHRILPFILLVLLSLSASATDPVRLWGKYTGGVSTDFIRASVTDEQGNVYVTGFTETTVGLSTPGAPQQNHGGFRDSYLSKYDYNGVLQWTTYLGGSGEDRGTSLAILPVSNNVVVSGYTNSSNNMADSNAHQPVYGGGSNDCFLSCYTPSGARLWSTYFGGPGLDEPYAVSTNAYGDIFMSGISTSSTGISTVNGFDTLYHGSTDGFLARFTDNGSLIWATYLGGSGTEYIYASVASDSMIWLGGKSSSIELATPGVHQTSKSNGTDGIFYAFNRNGNRIWSTYFGGPGEDIIWGVGYSDGFGNVIPSNKLYLSGQTSSSSGIATQGAHQTIYGGMTDALVASFNRNGILEWATYLGGTGTDMSYGMAFNATADLLVTGGTGSSNGISTPGAFQTNYGGGGEDAFLVRFDPYGQRIWGTYYGGASADWGYNTSCDVEGNIFLAGYTQSSSQIAFPTGNRIGGYDGMLVKFFECPENLIQLNPSDTSAFIGGSVSFEVLSPISPVYQWQMDDGTGFRNLSNAGPYNGVTNNVLFVSAISPWMNNYKYRCIISSSMCSDTSEAATLSISTVSVQKLEQHQLKLYPNPSKGTFHLSDPSGTTFNSISIFDLQGRLIYSLNYQENPATLVLPALSPGVYQIVTKSTAGVGINRLMIEK